MPCATSLAITSVGEPAVVGTPFFLINSETDLDLTQKPDSPMYRQWEVAGATHYSQHAFDYNQPLILRDFAMDIADGDSACIGTRRSRIPYHHVLNAAMDLTVRWIETGTAPPSQPRFQYGLDGAPARDERGNALGGIRLPEHAVPTATNRRGEASDAPFCYLYGSHAPFDAATLRALYPTHADYVQQFEAAADTAVSVGVLLPDDAALSKAAARAAAIPL